MRARPARQPLAGVRRMERQGPDVVSHLLHDTRGRLGLVIVAASPCRLSRTLPRPTTPQQGNRPGEPDHPVAMPRAYSIWRSGAGAAASRASASMADQSPVVTRSAGATHEPPTQATADSGKSSGAVSRVMPPVGQKTMSGNGAPSAVEVVRGRASGRANPGTTDGLIGYYRRDRLTPKEGLSFSAHMVSLDCCARAHELLAGPLGSAASSMWSSTSHLQRQSRIVYLAQESKSPGVINFSAAREIDRPNRFTLIERWSSTHQAYKASSTWTTFLANVGPLLAAPLDERDGFLLK